MVRRGMFIIEEFRRQPLIVVGGFLLCFSSIMSAVTGRLAYQAEKQTSENTKGLAEEIRAREHQSCERSNESRDGIRDSILLMVDAIAAAAPNADPGRVAAFRADVERRINEEIPSLDCG